MWQFMYDYIVCQISTQSNGLAIFSTYRDNCVVTWLRAYVSGIWSAEGDGIAAAGYLLFVSVCHLLPSHSSSESTCCSTRQM